VNRKHKLNFQYKNLRFPKNRSAGFLCLEGHFQGRNVDADGSIAADRALVLADAAADGLITWQT